MQKSNQHIIGKHTMEVDLPANADGFEWQKRISEFCNHELPAVIEKLFDSFADAENLIQIEKIELDLGKLKPNTNNSELKDIIVQKLEEQLFKIIKLKQTVIDGETIVMKQTKIPNAIFAEWLEFLDSGVLQWTAKDLTEEALRNEILEHVASEASALPLLKNALLKSRKVLERLVLQNSDDFLRRLLEAYSGNDQEHVLLYLNDIRTLHSKCKDADFWKNEKLSINNFPEIRKNFWNSIIRSIIIENKLFEGEDRNAGISRTIINIFNEDGYNLHSFFSFIKEHAGNFPYLKKIGIDALMHVALSIQVRADEFNTADDTKENHLHTPETTSNRLTHSTEENNDEIQVSSTSQLNDNEKTDFSSETQARQSDSELQVFDKREIKTASSNNNKKSVQQSNEIVSDQKQSGENSSTEEGLKSEKQADNQGNGENSIKTDDATAEKENIESIKHKNATEQYSITENSRNDDSYSDETKDKIQERFDNVREQFLKNDQQNSKSESRALAEKLAKKFPSKSSKYKEKDSLYIQNAGVVLLNPFFGNLFSKLELINGNEFERFSAQEKAVHLVHFIASGEKEQPEYEMILPKLLCGMDFEEPINRFIEWNIEELDEAENMMKAAINHWGALGDASPDALRHAFLQRDGKLEKCDDGWRLYIEQQTMDILLGRLPFGWGLGTIKLPWMKEFLHIEWG